MDYRLIFLTHGDPVDHGGTRQRTLNSFREMVTPRPKDGCLIYDGSVSAVAEAGSWNGFGWAWPCVATDGPVGFCRAVGAGWERACAPGVDFVFWLEHDFEFLRPVDLTAIAPVLDHNEELAQMALMRGSVNDVEKALGGVVADHKDRGTKFVSRVTNLGLSDERGEYVEWLSHQAYFTTNPSLMTRQFMIEHPWPDYPSECEGKFGIDLTKAGYQFGILGDGKPWVEHIGHRTGYGY